MRRHVALEELLNYQDDTTDVYFVLEGRLRATIFSYDGRETIFRDIQAGDFFGELSAIDGEPRSATVVALSDCLVATMTRPDFLTLAGGHSAVALALLKYLTHQVRGLTERVFQLGSWTVRYRLFAELLKLGDYGQVTDSEIVIRNFPTHGEIASKISTHREAVSKELSRLAREGVIKQRGRIMVLRQPRRLADMLHLD